MELLITAALVSIIFGGLYSGVQGMIQVIQRSKAKAGASALAVETLEYVRSLPYNDVGTVGGVPEGLIEPTGTTTLNGTTFYKRVLVEYVDDPADGFGGSDTNGILSDYKRVKVEFSWNSSAGPDSLSLVSSIMPIGIETTAGGGTIRVNVFDALTLPVSGAEVRFYNNTGTSTINTVRYTNADGVAYLAGAPALANYELYVTKAGYSEDGTYTPSATNTNPTTQPIAVVESAVSTMNFQIDKVSDLTIKTVGMATTDSFTDSFIDDSKVYIYASTTRQGSAIELEPNGSVYYLSGSVTSTTTSPSSFDSWYALNFTSTTSASTTALVFVLYDNAGTLNLIPDIDLPGNSSGFASGPVDLQGLDTSTYDTLALMANLSTLDDSETPALGDWSIEYIESQPILSSVPLHVYGSKTIGTDGSSQPVYKYEVSANTNGSGELLLTDTGFDSYQVDINSGAYQLIESCPFIPVNLAPDTAVTLTMTLASPSAAQTRVSVVDSLGDPVANADVRLENSGVDRTLTTGLCGQAYFSGGLYVANDYTLTVSAPGYVTEVLTGVVINSTSTVEVSVAP